MGRLGDVDDVVAGNGADGDVGSDVGRNQWQRLQVGCRGRCRKTVVVGQGVYTLSNAQQLHKSAAAVGTRATGHTASGGIQCLVQVRAAFERLDDGIGCGRGADGAVLRCGTLIRLDHVVIQTHGLGRGHGQQVTVLHHQLNPDVANGAHSFAFLQFVADLQGTADALGVDCEYGAIAIDGGEGCKLGQNNLR